MPEKCGKNVMDKRKTISSPDTGDRDLVRVSGLGKTFAVNRAMVAVLKDVNFDVAAGEFLCILGPSGCGKSTLLGLMAGFFSSSSGKILVRGRPVTGPGPDRAVVFQEDALFPWLTIEENIAFGLKQGGHTPKERQAKVDRFLDLMGLTRFRHYLPREISGGMKQRTALARVLVLDPDILLMDEPFGALDAQTREKMQDLLLGIWQDLGQTVVFVTHDVREAVVLADRVLVMGADPGNLSEMTISMDRPRRTEAPEVAAHVNDLRSRLSATS